MAAFKLHAQSDPTILRGWEYTFLGTSLGSTKWITLKKVFSDTIKSEKPG